MHKTHILKLLTHTSGDNSDRPCENVFGRCSLGPAEKNYVRYSIISCVSRHQFHTNLLLFDRFLTCKTSFNIHYSTSSHMRQISINRQHHCELDNVSQIYCTDNESAVLL